MIEKDKKIGLMTKIDKHLLSIDYSNVYHTCDVEMLLIEDIIRKCCTWKTKYNIDFVILNNLEVLKTREEDTLACLKALSKGLGINIIVVLDHRERKNRPLHINWMKYKLADMSIELESNKKLGKIYVRNVYEL